MVEPMELLRSNMSSVRISEPTNRIYKQDCCISFDTPKIVKFMAKTKKQLLSSAPWRGEQDDDSDKFADGKVRVTNQPGGTATMHVPRKKSGSSKNDDYGDSLVEIDPELRYSFQRNYQFLQRVFSIDTIVKPLPPAMAYNVSRNLSFFTRIFTQFSDPEGIANAQKSLGLGYEEKDRRVR